VVDLDSDPSLRRATSEPVRGMVTTGSGRAPVDRFRLERSGTVCVEFGSESAGERGWRAYLTADEDDEPAEAGIYCPTCATRILPQAERPNGPGALYASATATSPSLRARTAHFVASSTVGTTGSAFPLPLQLAIKLTLGKRQEPREAPR
jgi:hypothetical protein